MLRHLLLAATTLLALPSIACVGDVDPPDAPESRRPLARPASFVAGERRWFVLRKIDLGMKNAHAWKELGFDLDRRATTAEQSTTSANSCKRRAGSSRNVLADGADGIDNSFGAHAVAVMKSIKDDAEDVANAELESGGYTLLLRIDGVVGADNASAPGALYAAGPHIGKPSFAADDRWPVWSTTLADGVDLEKPLRTFPLGYLRNGTWVSGEIGEKPDPIWFPLFGPLEMNASTLLSVDLASGRGTMAGALPVEELTRMTTRWVERFGVCPGDRGYDLFTTVLSDTADLVLAAPDLQDPSRECNALSFGIGFEVARVSAPTTVVAPAPMDAPRCPGKP